VTVAPAVEEEEEEGQETVAVAKTANGEKEEGSEDKEKEKEGEKEGEEDSLVHIVEPDEEDEMWEKVNERKISRTLPPRPARGSTVAEVWRK
jgi:hypothetical protein